MSLFTTGSCLQHRRLLGYHEGRWRAMVSTREGFWPPTELASLSSAATWVQTILWCGRSRGGCLSPLQYASISHTYTPQLRHLTHVHTPAVTIELVSRLGQVSPGRKNGNPQWITTVLNRERDILGTARVYKEKPKGNSMKNNIFG